MTGVALIIAFVLAIIVMIVAISKFKVHPFLAIMTVSLILAMMAGIPFVILGISHSQEISVKEYLRFCWNKFKL